MNGTRSLCTLQQVSPANSTDPMKMLRLTLQNDSTGEKQKPVGRAFAISSKPSGRTRSLDSELVKSTDGDEEIIKVYLKARAESKAKHDWNVSQLRDEARTSLIRLREDISWTTEKPEETAIRQQVKAPLERPNGLQHPVSSWSRRASTESEVEELPGAGEIEALRETTRKLLAKLQDAEKRHQSDRRAFEDTLGHYQKEVEQSSRALRKAEDGAAVKQTQVEELQRLMGGMEKEHHALLKKLEENESELRAAKESSKQQNRSAELEKEVAALREKIHHLDDMLKSQQRKVRNMIEQLQNSRMVIHERDRIIQELQERVSSLQAENLEMHDRMEHLLGYQTASKPSASKSYTKSTPSVPLNGKRVYTPAGPLKPLALIRLVET
ncbi:tuftelin isoform X2 [Rhinatrema bivittatum]|uniref:tuftelin isoform X2 n=1 Tax=Rhinatrema bivittatum TaxID=194408 RepID=UPI00112D3166|nr:tuftelin isoform X2 [Rhinatrema bivittatum]